MGLRMGLRMMLRIGLRVAGSESELLLRDRRKIRLNLGLRMMLRMGLRMGLRIAGSELLCVVFKGFRVLRFRL